MKSLVGYTGFVGSNIAAVANFDRLYNSRNIEEAYGTKPNLLVYSGVRAEKFIANKYPQEDLKCVENAFNNILKIQPEKLVLISTIDVFGQAVNVDEDSQIDANNLSPYGYNRYHLEQQVMECGIKHLIIRLPGLYGENIKKNFIFDMINVIPALLSAQKFDDLIKQNGNLKKYYKMQENGYYKYDISTQAEKDLLKEMFRSIGFTAMNFTDSRGIFQFYNLAYLWDHINIALNEGIKLLNIATEPVGVSELYHYIWKEQFKNELSAVVPYYDFRTKHSKVFNGSNGYIFNKEYIMNDIKEFVKGYTKK